MTDASTAEIARSCAALSPATVPARVLEDARLLVVDTLGTLVGGWDSPPARIAQELASHETSAPGARVVGLDRPSSVEAAAFASQPLAVEEMRPRELESHAGAGQVGDRLAVQTIGALALAHERAHARLDPEHPRGADHARARREPVQSGLEQLPVSGP